MGRVAPLLAACLLGAGCLAVASIALAHSPSRVEPGAVTAPVAGPAPTDAPAISTPAAEVPDGRGTSDEQRAGPAGWVVLAAGMLTMALLVGRHPRRALVAAIVLALVVLAFESSVHAVHHLGDSAAAAECSVAWATAHLAGTPAEPPSIDTVTRPVVEQRPVAVPWTQTSQPYRPDTGRAPPLPLSAA